MGGRKVRAGLERGVGGVGAAATGGGGFARALASSDWHTRERGLLSLEKFLRARGAALPPAELRRLWRGLFYCFWHADLAPVQAELAHRLAGFLRIGGDDEGADARPKKRARGEGGEAGEVLEGDLAGRYLRAFMWTMAREWGGLDRHRLDKFMLLVREFLRAALQRLQVGGWEPAEATEVAEALAEALDPPGPGRQGSLGVALHLADILVDEIELSCTPGGGGAGGSGSSESDSGSDSEDVELPEMIPGDALTALLEPFVGCACRPPGTSMRVRISELFQRLQGRTLQGLRYLLSGKGAQGGLPFIQLDARTLCEVMFEAAAAVETQQEDRETLYALVPGFEKIHALQQDLVTGRGGAEDGSDEEDADGSEEEEEEGFGGEDLGLATPSSSSEEVEGDDELWEDASGSGSGEDLGEMGGELDALDAEEECREEEEEEAEREERRSAKKERREAKRAKKEVKRGERRSEDVRPGMDAPGTSAPSAGTPGKKSVHFRLKKNMVREFLKTEKLLCSPSKATPRKSALREGQAPSPLFPRFLKKQKREAKEAAAWGEAPQDEPPRVGGAPSSRGGRGGFHHGRGGSPRERSRSPRGLSRPFRGRGGSPRGRGRSPQGVRQNWSFRG